MKVRSLATFCVCGGLVPPTLLWVSEDSKLITEGICLGCGDKVTARITFKELGILCEEFKQVEQKLLPPANNDKEWLHEMGISNE